MFSLYIFWLVAKGLIAKIFKRKLCAICATVTTTWILLFVLKFLGYEIPILILGILMGESVTGLMYWVEKKAREKGEKKLLILRPLIIILGTIFIYFLLRFVYG
ncbi:MAG: hypothetical protein QXQ18_01635 [Candidatus Aenigmatarchaeota archaeon]